MNPSRSELARTTLGVLFIGALTLASFWVLRPFLPAFIWAVMIVVATWPLMRGVEAWAGGRRWVAVLAMTLAMLLIFLLPLVVAIGTMAQYADTLATWVTGLAASELPRPPAWVAGVPLIGERVASVWDQFAGSGFHELAARVEPYARDIARWIVAEAGTIGLMFVQVLLIVALSAVLYSGGEAWGRWVMAFGRRLADERGESAVILAGQAIRGVALGVVVTALVQSALGGIGLAIAGVPFAAALTAVMFFLCIAQLGPLLVLLAATGWLFFTEQSGWGTFLLVWSAVVGIMDNFMRPLLIKRGADLPLMLIFAGVIGGMLSFGLIGLFVGPVVLAVTYTLVDVWVGAPADGAT